MSVADTPITPPKFSGEYNYVRTRELEGTYPGDPQLGIWAVNSCRVAMGWGMA